MLATIEITRRDHIGDPVPGGVVEHQTTEQRLLGVEIVRRHPHPIHATLGGERGKLFGIRVEHEAPGGKDNRLGDARGG
ncbi:hypothetical protein McPS_11430 [Marichromatium sp. PS1]